MPKKNVITLTLGRQGFTRQGPGGPLCRRFFPVQAARIRGALTRIFLGHLLGLAPGGVYEAQVTDFKLFLCHLLNPAK